MLPWAPNVRVHYFSEPIARVLHLASVWALVARVGVVVNSMNDRAHGPNSLHGWDLAIDLDTADDRSVDLAQLHGYLARHLPLDYDVVLETDHVHVEWDVKRRTAPTTRAGT